MDGWDQMQVVFFATLLSDTYLLGISMHIELSGMIFRGSERVHAKYEKHPQKDTKCKR